MTTSTESHETSHHNLLSMTRARKLATRPGTLSASDLAEDREKGPEFPAFPRNAHIVYRKGEMTRASELGFRKTARKVTICHAALGSIMFSVIRNFLPSYFSSRRARIQQTTTVHRSCSK